MTESFEIKTKEFDKNTIDTDVHVLVVSDIHLGSRNCNLIQLKEFLDAIKNNKFGQNLEKLIIIGDFLDLMINFKKNFTTPTRRIIFKRTMISKSPQLMADYMRIERNQFTYRDVICYLCGILQSKTNLKIIFALGNHEIKIYGNSDKKFSTRSEEIANIFQKRCINCTQKKNMLDNIEITQYVVIDKNLNPKCYHSVKDFKNEAFPILLSHGHQYESKFFREIVGRFVWRRIFNIKEDWKKSLYDYIWNDYLYREKEKRMMNPDHPQQNILTEKWVRKKLAEQGIKGTKIEKDIIFYLKSVRELKWLLTRKTAHNYHKAIEKFIKKKLKREGLHVIYGHTHIKEEEGENLISNTGTWQNYYSEQHKKSTYITISL
ncbi:MAG: metallophosphoesterase [Promethearchaeota archaeon]